MAQRKTTARKTTSRRKKDEEIPEVCDHSMENAERLKCLSTRVDGIGSKLTTIEENHLSHIQGDIKTLKAESKETKEKLHEMKEEQVEMRTDIKHIIKGSERTEKYLFKILAVMIGGGGGIAALVAFGDKILAFLGG